MINREDILIRFGNHLTYLRKKRGLSIRQLAASSGLEYSQLQRIEKGKVNFAFSTLEAISEGLNISLEEFFKNYIK